MSTTEEPFALAAIQSRANAAMDEVARICDPGERFRMSIPADPKRDSDLLLMDSLTDVPMLVAALADRDATIQAVQEWCKTNEYFGSEMQIIQDLRRLVSAGPCYGDAMQAQPDDEATS